MNFLHLFYIQYVNFLYLIAFIKLTINKIRIFAFSLDSRKGLFYNVITIIF